MTGLYRDVSGLALGTGLYRGVSGLWGGASGLVDGFGGEFSPASLFAAGEQGAWYDPSDLSTLFQDSAGTTPVTAAGQPVGRMVDKSGRGNHATQATAAARPTLGRVPATGRRNLLTFTEQFDNAAWSKVQLSVTANAAVAPDGTTTADALTPSAGTVTPYVFQSYTTSASAFVFSFYAKPNGYNFVQFSDGVSASDYCNFDLTNGTVGASVGYVGSISAESGGYYRCRVTKTFTAAATELRVEPIPSNLATRRPTYTADGTSGILIWGAQLETGSTATAYQTVVSAFDVTEAGVADLYYLSFDGVDDSMATANIVPGTNKAQVFAGVRKLSDVATGEVVGLSTSPGGLSGTFFLRAPSSASASYQYRSRGTSANGVIYTNALVAAPVTNVLTGLSDISGPSEALRVNGAVVGSNTLTQGTGNYLTYPLYIGRSGGTTMPFNGQIFGLIVRFGTNLSAATITQTETWMGQRVAPTVVI
jgi:hypothetical protein